jgi:glucokinase
VRKLCYVGIDLGGTTVKAVRLADDEVGVVERIPTLGRESPGRILDDIAHLVTKVAAGASIASVGIAMPGLVDPVTGSNSFAGNLRWRDVAVREELEKRLKVPVVAENDANAAALGEHSHGLTVGVSDFLFLSLGTGIGGGVFAGGHLLSGCRGAAGEIGHMILSPQGPRCSCGSNGCLEALAGGWAIIRDAQAAIKQGQETVLNRLAACGEPLDVKAVAEAARSNDAVAREIICRALFWLGLGVANAVNLLNPSLVVLGGGLSLMGDPLLEAVRDAVATYGMPTQRESVRIELSQLKDYAGVLGAVELARRSQII